MPTSEKFYSTEELLHIGEHFVDEKGTVNLTEFAKELLNCRMTKGLRTNVYNKGIHQL